MPRYHPRSQFLQSGCFALQELHLPRAVQATVSRRVLQCREPSQLWAAQHESRHRYVRHHHRARQRREYAAGPARPETKLEAEGGSAFSTAEEDYDPFETATGYHRIALDVINGLLSEDARVVVVNVPNQGAIEDLARDDVVEVPCDIDSRGPRPRKTGRLPRPCAGWCFR